MKSDLPGQDFGVSQGIYGYLLRAYPLRHRAQYGAAMAQLFRDQCRDAWNESQTWGLCKLWLRVLPDLACTSILERLAALNERKTMTEKLANLCAFRGTPAAIFVAVFGVVFLVVFIISVAITFILPESYASTARIKVESDAPTTNGQPLAYGSYFIQTTFEIIQSQLVLSNVIARLNLNVEWGKKYFAGQTLKSSETMEMLKPRMQLAQVKNTKLIAITVYSDDKQEAAQIANAIAESYRDYRVDSVANMKAQGMETLLQGYQMQEDQIHTAQSAVESLRQELKIGGEATASQSAQEQPYWDGKRNLSQLLDLHKLLYAKILAEKMDGQMPQSTLVQIVDRAEPGRAPVKPNKTLNIVLGAVAGFLLATLAGAAFAFLSHLIGQRSRKNAGAV